MASRKIGLLGGTFNPIHNAHLILGEAAREQFGLDRVIFMPSGISYMKENDNVTPGELRYQMVKLAIDSNPYFTCSRLEIDREGKTYTIDTLRELKKMYPGDEIYFIVGGDTFKQLESWYEAKEIFANCVILAGVRGSLSIEEMDKHRRYLHDKYGADIRLLQLNNIEISSSDIRARIKNGRSVRYMLPESVIDFASIKNLYNGMPAPDNSYDDVKIYNG